jgi:glycosyltransferase involved in cell wall biosynthesis
MNIYALADTVGDWYPKQALELFRRYSTLTFSPQPENADLIWIFSYYLPLTRLLSVPEPLARAVPSIIRRKRRFRTTPVVTTLHHLSPYKERLWGPKVDILNRITDVWHIPSRRNLVACRPLLRKPAMSLPYWIDTQQFFPLPAEERRRLRQRYRLPSDRRIFASFQRDTEADLVSPKLEKGPDLFCDALEQLKASSVFVLLAGMRRQYVERRLQRAGIPFRNLGTVPVTELNALYNVTDEYLVTSRTEGGPQAILEAMATKTNIFSTHVGIADLLHPAVLVTGRDDLVAKLERPYPHVLEKHFTHVQEYDCRRVIRRYDQFFTLVSESPLQLNQNDAAILNELP